MNLQNSLKDSKTQYFGRMEILKHLCLVIIVLNVVKSTGQLRSMSYTKTTPISIPSIYYRQAGQRYGIKSACQCAALCDIETNCSYFFFNSTIKTCILVGFGDAFPNLPQNIHLTSEFYTTNVGCSFTFVKQLNKCIDIITDKVNSWNTAQAECQENGGILFVINSDAEFIFFRDLFLNDFPGRVFFCGAHFEGNDFFWQGFNGEQQLVKSYYWAGNQPDNRFGSEFCTAFRDRNDYFLNDVGCEYYDSNYVCEYPV